MKRGVIALCVTVGLAFSTTLVAQNDKDKEKERKRPKLTNAQKADLTAINELIVDQVRGLGCTAVSITHDLASARTIGDEIAMLHGGKIVWRGSPAELDSTDNPYVRQFVDGRADGPMASVV